MLTFFQSLVGAQIFAAYHQHIARLPASTPRLARLMMQRYAVLFSFDQQLELAQQAQACAVIEATDRQVLFKRLKQGAMLWSLWVLGAVWGWSWILLGVAAIYGLGYTPLGQQLVQAMQLLGISNFLPTQVVLAQLTRVFWVVAGLTTLYWAWGLAGLCVGIVGAAALLQTPEGTAFLNWAKGFVQYVWDRFSGVWTETLLHTAALQYEFVSEKKRLKESLELSDHMVLVHGYAALQQKYQAYQEQYHALRPATWQLWLVYAIYRLQGMDTALAQAWAVYRAQLLQTLTQGLLDSTVIAQHPDPRVLVQHLVSVRTLFAQDAAALASLPSMLELVCQIPFDKLTQPTDQPLVEGHTGRGLNIALLQAAGQASEVLRAVVAADQNFPYGTVLALENAISTEGGRPAVVLPVVQQLLLKLPRIRSREVMGCLKAEQQQGVQQQLARMYQQWLALGQIVVDCLQGLQPESALALNALKLWRVTYTELQDKTLESVKWAVQDQICTFFNSPTRVLSIEILAVLDCLETAEQIQKYQADYLHYWMTAMNQQYAEQHQALVVHNTGNQLSEAASTFLRQVVLPNHLSWFEALSLQQGVLYHPAFIAELAQQGCIGLSGVLLYCQQVPQTALLEGCSQKALVQQIQNSTALVVGNSVDVKTLTLQILQGEPTVVKQNIETVNRLGALGKAFLGYGEGSALPSELLVHLEGYLNTTVALEGETGKLLQEMVTAGTKGIARLLKENAYYFKKLLERPLFWTGLSFEQLRGLVQHYPEELPQLGLYYGLAAQREGLCVLGKEWEQGYWEVINTHHTSIVALAKQVMPYTASLMEQLAVPLIEDFHAVKAGKFNNWKAQLDLQFLFGFQASNRWRVWSTLYATHRSFKKNSCAQYWTAKIRDTLRYMCFQELQESYKDEQQRYEDYKQVFLKVIKPVYQQLWMIEVFDASLFRAILMSALSRKAQDLPVLRLLIVDCMHSEQKKTADLEKTPESILLKEVFKGRKQHKNYVKDARGFLRFHKQCPVYWAPLMDYPKQGQQAFEQLFILELVENLMFEADLKYREVDTVVNAVKTFFLGAPTEAARWAQWKKVALSAVSLDEAESDEDRVTAPTVLH